MVFTHVLVGIFVGAISAVLFPGFTAAAVAGGALGGLFPDLDMVFVHRRTLHFPVLFNVAGLVAVALAVLSPGTVTLFASVFLLAAGLHSLMDTLGGGKEMRPWRETDERAVFNHVSGQWITPRRLIYDGSIPDLAIAILVGGLAAYVLPGGYSSLVIGLLVVASTYTVLRRWVTRVISEDFDTFSEYIQYKLRATYRKITG